MSAAPPFSLLDSTAARACAAASGYAFALGAPPTRAQLRAMCAQDDCAAAANGCLLRGRNGPSRTEQERIQLREFAYVLLDFCYYYREPDAPCADDFLAQLLDDLQELVAACETKSGVALTAAGPANTTGVDFYALCGVDECDNLMRRLYVKPSIRTCEPMFTDWTPDGNVPAAYKPVIRNWVYPYKESCPVSLTLRWYLPITYFDSESVKYVYLPGPLPGDPTTTTTAPTLTEAPNSTSSETPSPTESSTSPLTAPPSIPPVRTPSPEPTTATVTLVPVEIPLTSTPTPTPITSRTPRPIPSTTSAKFESSSSSSDSSWRDDGRSEGSLEGAVTSGADIAPPAASNEAVPAPSIRVPASSSNATPFWSLGLGVAAIVVMLFVFIVYRRRQRRSATTRKLDGDDTYRSLTDFGDTSCTVGGVLLTCKEIPIAQLREIRIIGGGGSGIVCLVRDTGNNNRLLASKRVNKRNATSTEIDAFVAEIALASSLSHPRIVQFIAIAGLHKSDLQGLFEYMAGGDLCRYLSLLPPIDPTRHSWTLEKLQIAIDVVDALAYIHNREPTPIVHRDLKSRNVMLTSDHRAKLGDFGISRAESAMGSMTTGVGTTRWVAPEVILGGGDYSTACDIYSFGVVLTELDTHRLPFSELVTADGDQLADFVVLELVATQRQQPSLSGTCPDGIRELARRCLSFEPSDRPTAQEVISVLRCFQEALDLV